MQHKHAVEALDRTLKDLFHEPGVPDKPFGGITVLFGGDFRQTLPVVPRGSTHQILAASLRNSYLWRHIYKCFSCIRTCAWIKLQRVISLPSIFWMLVLEKIQTLMGMSLFHPNMRCGDSVDSLINAIYPGIATWCKA
jgi:hypothetical protein